MVARVLQMINRVFLVVAKVFCVFRTLLDGC